MERHSLRSVTTMGDGNRELEKGGVRITDRKSKETEEAKT